MFKRFFIPQICFEGEGTSSGTPAETPTPTPAATPPATPPAETPAQKPWHLDRIDQLTREKYELKAEIDKKGTPAPTPAAETKPTQQLSQQEIDRLVTQRAAELNNVKSFNDQCNAAYEKGIAAHPDFQAKLNILNSLAGGVVQREIVEAALETGDGEEVLYELGSKPELAQELMGLSPARMAVKMAQIANKLPKKGVKPISKAPAPIEQQVSSQTEGEKPMDDPTMSMKEWTERRNKQLKEKNAARNR